MANEKSKSFFGICPSVMRGKKPESATASLYLNNWPFQDRHQPEALILEGINQFASRLVTLFFPGDGKTFYLPTMIENFHMVLKEIPARLDISGHGERIHDTYRVVCKVTAANSDEIIATAAIIVSKSQVGVSVKARNDDNPHVPVWTVEQNTGHQINAPVCFQFNKAHPLFTEHFPEKAVAPGSMLIEILLKRLMLFYPRMNSVTLSRVKFVLPVVPDIPHCLYINFSQRDLTASFALCIQSNEKRTAMGKVAFTLAEGEE